MCPRGFCGEGLARTCFVRGDGSDGRSTNDMAVLSARVAPPTRNKIEHGRVLIVLRLLGHRGVVKSAISASRSRHRRRSLEITNNCCEHAS